MADIFDELATEAAPPARDIFDEVSAESPTISRAELDQIQAPLLEQARDPANFGALAAIRARQEFEPVLKAESEYADLSQQLQKEGVQAFAGAKDIVQATGNLTPAQEAKIVRMQELHNTLPGTKERARERFFHPPEDWNSRGDILPRLFGDTVAAQADKGMNRGIEDSAGGLAGGALGARMLTGATEGPVGVLLPLAGAVIGSVMGGQAQEGVRTAVENSPEETEARRAKQAALQSDPEYRAGSLLGMAALFRPSLSVTRAALTGNPEAVQQVALGGALGAGSAFANALLQKRLPTGEELKDATISGLAFHQPTQLASKLFGFHPLSLSENPGTGTVRTPIGTLDSTGNIVEPGTPEGTALRSLVGVDATTPTEHIDLRPAPELAQDALPTDFQSGLTTRGTTSTADVFDKILQEDAHAQPIQTPSTPDGGVREPEVPPVDEVVPAPEGGAGIPPGGSERVAPETPGEAQSPVGIRNAFTEAERTRMGLPPRDEPISTSFPELRDAAEAAYAKDPRVGDRLVEELKDSPRQHSPEEAAVLTFEMAKRQKALDDAYDAVNRSGDDPEAFSEAQRRLVDAANQYHDAFQASERSGTPTGQALAARKMLLNQDFTLGRMLARTQATENNGQPLNGEQVERVTKVSKGLERTKAGLEKVAEKQADQTAAQYHERLLKSVGKEARQAAKKKQSAVDFFEAHAEAARKRIVGRRGRLQTGDPLNLAGLVDEAIIGASHIAKGVRDFAQWSKQMLGEFGDRISPHLKELFGRSSAIEAENSKPFRNPTPKEVLAESDGGLTPKLAGDLWLAHIREGMSETADIRKAVHGELLPRNPGLTERQVSEALTQYGKTTFPSREADQVALREMKTIERLGLQIEDLRKGIPALKTGPQRDKSTAKIRELEKERNALMRRNGINPTDPAKQLASAHTARVTRLRNSIEELAKNIAEGKRTPKSEGVPWTPEEIALRDQVEAMRDQLDSVLNQPESDKLNSLLKRIEVVTEKLKTGQIEPKSGKPTADTAEVARAKETLKGLNRDLMNARRAARLRDNPPKTEDEKRLASLEQQRDTLALRVADGDTSTKTGKPTAATAEQSRVQQEIEGLQQLMTEMRKAERPQRPQDQSEFNALQRRLEIAQKKLATGDTGPAGRKMRVDTERVTAARAQLDAVNQKIREVRDAVRNSPAERLERDKQNIRNRMAELQRRIAAGDYAPKPKPDPVTDREKSDLEFQEEQLKQRFNEGLIESKRAQRPTLQRIGSAVAETFRTARTIMTAGDFAALFRQGLFSLGRPVTAAKAVADSFRAMVSEKQRSRIEHEIRNRPNAPLYKSSGLYLAKEGSNLTQMEEAYAANWVKKLPRKSIIGPLVRASERSYTTFLNKLRADTFDAMNASLGDQGNATLEQQKVIADAINVFTGRGSVHGFERAANALNTFFFAPRLMKSRFEALLLKPLYRGNLGTKKVVAMEYARALTGIAVVYSLLKAAGAAIETDPRSTDFMKARFGKTRLDLTGGLGSVTRFLTRYVTGEKKTQGGRVEAIRPGGHPLKYVRGYDLNYDPNAYQNRKGNTTMEDFLRGKLNPIVGTAWDFGKGQDVTGKPFSAGRAAANLVTPISWNDVYQAMKEQGAASGTALSILSMFGAGMQTYQQNR